MVTPVIPVKSSAAILNSVGKQYMNLETVINDDLSNIIEFFRPYEALSTSTKRIVTGDIATLVTRDLVKTKNYAGINLDLVLERVEYGQHDGIIRKIRFNFHDAVDDSDVYDPEPGSSSDPFEAIPIASEVDYVGGSFQARFEVSKPERWMTGMFLSADGFNEFVAGLDQSIQNSIQLYIDNVSLALIRASIVYNLYEAQSSPGGLGGRGTAKAVNVLALYNEAFPAPEPLLAVNALQTPEFLRFASLQMWSTLSYMSALDTTYNVRGYPNWTTQENARFIRLAVFDLAFRMSAQSDTFHKDLIDLPLATTVVRWKAGTVEGYPSNSFEASSTVKDTITLDDGVTKASVDTSGVIGVISDKEHVGIHKLAIHTTSQYDPKNLKENVFHHLFGKTAIDLNENSVVFYIKDAAPVEG